MILTEERKNLLMKLQSLFVVFFCIASLLGCASSAKNAPVVVETEEIIYTEKKNDKSIVTTSSAICEILDLLDYDNVIGMPETANKLPERYKDAMEVGAAMNPDLEIIKSLNPDYVLSPISLKDALQEQYNGAGIEAIFLDLSSVQGMYESITLLGELLEREEDAKVLEEAYVTYMEVYEKENTENSSCMILMCFPSGYYLLTTENSYVGNIVNLAGGENVYGQHQGDENGFVSINPEDMISKNPDKIFVFAHYDEEETFLQMEKSFKEDSTWQYFDAVKNNEVYYLSSEYVGMSANMSWFEALDYLKPMLYGE